MGLLSDTKNDRLRMRRECRESFPCHRLERKPLVSDSGMHHGTCVTHVPWCMSGSLTRCGAENVAGIPGAWAARNFTYLARGPWCLYGCHYNVAYGHFVAVGTLINISGNRMVVRIERFAESVMSKRCTCGSLGKGNAPLLGRCPI